MKNWSASDWVMIILTLTIPVCLIGIMVVRAITKQPISPEAINVLEKIFAAILVAVVAISGVKNINKKTE